MTVCSGPSIFHVGPNSHTHYYLYSSPAPFALPVRPTHWSFLRTQLIDLTSQPSLYRRLLPLSSSFVINQYNFHLTYDMGGNTEFIAGCGYLSLGQAVHVAQNSEGGVDQRLVQFLERELAIVWSKLNAQPDSYVLPSDEFALMNYYRIRFGDNELVRSATKRFWDNYKGAA